MGRMLFVFVMGMTTGAFIIVGYTNCSHVSKNELMHRMSVSKKGERGRLPTSQTDGVEFESEKIDLFAEDEPEFQFRLNRRPPGHLQPESNEKTNYPPQSFTLSIDGRGISHRDVREYVLSITKLPPRPDQVQETTDSVIAVHLTPRSKFPSPLSECSELYLVLDQETVQTQKDAKEIRYLKIKDRLTRVRGFEVKGPLEKYISGGRSVCQTRSSRDINLHDPTSTLN